jgi:hypothetical protein
MIRVKTFQSETELAVWMENSGLKIGAVQGPAVNGSGQAYVVYDDSEAPSVISRKTSPYGVAYADATAGAGDYELGEQVYPVTAEDLGALPSSRTVSATLANAAGHYLVPGSVSIPGPTPLIDNGSGSIVTVGSLLKRGTVNYSTHQVVFTYQATDRVPAGNVLIDYEYTALPDSSDLPDVCFIWNLSVTGASGNIDFTIWNDSNLTIPAVTGTITVVGGVGVFRVEPYPPLSISADLTIPDRNKRWITVSGACEIYLYWSRIS